MAQSQLTEMHHRIPREERLCCVSWLVSHLHSWHRPLLDCAWHTEGHHNTLSHHNGWLVSSPRVPSSKYFPWLRPARSSQKISHPAHIIDLSWHPLHWLCWAASEYSCQLHWSRIHRSWDHHLPSKLQHFWNFNSHQTDQSKEILGMLNSSEVTGTCLQILPLIK